MKKLAMLRLFESFISQKQTSGLVGVSSNTFASWTTAFLPLAAKLGRTEQRFQEFEKRETGIRD